MKEGSDVGHPSACGLVAFVRHLRRAVLRWPPVWIVVGALLLVRPAPLFCLPYIGWSAWRGNPTGRIYLTRRRCLGVRLACHERMSW